MDILCTADMCPVILNSTCVFYEGNNLTYTGINTNDSIQTALQKIDAKFGDANVGYIFTNGVVQLSPGQPVKLGGSLIEDTTIGGNFTLSFVGPIIGSKLATAGGTASEFLKGDGTLDNTPYQVAGAYITNLSGDVVASGPGTAVATLASVNSNPGTYGDGTHVPRITVDSKGRITAVTSTAISLPSSVLSFTGDVYGSGSTGATTTLTLNDVNLNVYNSNTFLKFKVNAKGLVTGATPVTGLDINSALGFTPVPNTRTITINGVTQTLQADRSWTLPGGGSVTSVSATAGTGIAVSVTNPTTAPNITITNTAPDQVVSIAAGTGINVTGSYPNFTVAATNTGSVTGVTASAPLASSGGTTPNITISQASTSTDGYLSSTDWNTFNNKQAAGNYITDLTGEASASGPGSTNVTLSNSAVTGKVLTGINITGGSVVATDSILEAFGKVQNQINGLIGGSIYKGTWNASTNTPTITSGVGTTGWYYIVSVPGSTNIDGITDWNLGDWIIFDGTAWQQVDNTDAVVSVNGQTGAVSLTTDNIPEGATNKYFTTAAARLALSAGTGISYDNITGVISSTITQYTDSMARAAISAGTGISYSSSTGVISSTITQYTDALARQAISLTTTGTSGAATYDNITGVLNIPDYSSGSTGYVPYTGATQNLNLGEYGVSAGYVGFDTTPTATPTTLGTMYWDTFYRTLSLIDGDGDTTLQIGQEERLLIHNNTGATLTDGQVVYVTGSTGELPSVSLADASSESTSAATLGVVTESILNGTDGFVTVSGIVHGLNTLAYNEGDILWLSETAGQFTNVKPISPAHLVLIGYVIKKAGGNGSILVKIQNTQELSESSDVLISAPEVDGQGLFLQTISGTQLWRNRTIADVLGYTPANAAITISTTAPLQGGGDLSANRTFSITQSTTSTDGYLSSTDWNTFNSKQAGSANLTSLATLAFVSESFVKMTGPNTFALDTTAYYPASNPNGYTSNVGTVTSVAALTIGTTGTDISSSVANGTTTPVITLNIPTASATNRGALSAADWATFNSKQNAFSGTTNYVTKFTGTSTIGNSVIFDDGTNVGFFTNAPTANVHIKSLNNLTLKNEAGIDDSIQINNLVYNASGALYDYFTDINASYYTTIFYHPAGYIGGNGSSTYVMFFDTGYDTATSQSLFFQLNGYKKLQLKENGEVVLGADESSTSTWASYPAVLRGPQPSIYAANTIGGSLTLQGGRGTGTGVPGDVIIKTGTAGSSGTTYSTMSDRLVVKGNTGQLRLNAYTSSTSFTGTVAGILGFDSSGNIITTTGGGTTINGTGFVKASGTTISYDNSTYTPTNGTGATGTWSISITGNAGSVGNVDITRIVYGDNATKTITFSNANDYLSSGFYNAYGAGNMPSTDWYHLITNRHNNVSNNYQLQIAGGFFDNNVWTRKMLGSTSGTAWARLLNTVVDVYPSNMDQYVRTSDFVRHTGLQIFSTNNSEVAGGMKMISHSVNKVGSSKFIKIYAGTNNYFTGFIFGYNFDNYPPNSATNTGAGFAYQFGGWSDGNGSVGEKYFDLQWFGGNNVGNLGREYNTDGYGLIITTPTSTGAGGYKASATVMIFARDTSKLSFTYY